MTLVAKVVLPPDRNDLGIITLFDQLSGLPTWGPKFCYGRADLGAAIAHGNVIADPTQAWGNTPTGEFEIVGIRQVQNAEKPVYGAQDALLLRGVVGPAMIREANSGHQLLIHGGRPSFGLNLLRPTNGCLRMLDLDLQNLLSAIAADGDNFPMSMSVVEGDPGQLVVGGPDDGFSDPSTA